MNASHRERTDEAIEQKAVADARADRDLEHLESPTEALEGFAYWLRIAEVANEQAWRTVHGSRAESGEPPWWAVGAVLDVSSESARARANYAYEKYGLGESGST